jgi:hypothetical protein
VLVGNLRRNRLGAEELIELGRQWSIGQVRTPVAPVIPPKAPTVAAASGPSGRTVVLSKAEAQLLIKVVEKIVAFRDKYQVEYISYCPEERWQKTMTEVGSTIQQIEGQVNAGSQQISVPADAVLKMVDLEKCISAARDARLDSARLAFGISAGAAIVSTFLGWKWISIPAYITGLAILFGRPLYAKYYPDPQDPYQPDLAGVKPRYSMGSCAPPKETEEQKKRVKLRERIVLPADPGIKSYYWGEVDCMGRGPEGSVCLEKGRFRVRIEGWAGDIVRPVNGWKYAKDCEKESINEIGVWEPGMDRQTMYGPIPEESIHPDTYFVEYIGPNTGGRVRRAGPFGCPLDTRDHGIEDGGITKLGVDGDVAMFDGEGNPVEVPPMGK